MNVRLFAPQLLPLKVSAAELQFPVSSPVEASLLPSVNLQFHVEPPLDGNSTAKIFLGAIPPLPDPCNPKLIESAEYPLVLRTRTIVTDPALLKYCSTAYGV